MTNVREAWNQYRSYRRTLAELRGLSTRLLRDLDLDHSDIDGVARRAVYGR